MIKAAASSMIKEDPAILESASQVMTQLFAQSGGLVGLINSFKENNLEDIINSWMSNQEKLPISADQLSQVFGQDTIKQLAEKVKLDPSIFNILLTKGLPKVVREITQEGKIAPADAPSLTAQSAKELLNRLFS